MSGTYAANIGKALFIPAEIGTAGEAGVRYMHGMNNSGTCQDELLKQVAIEDGTVRIFVVMRGLSRAKAEAIAMILNAPEP